MNDQNKINEFKNFVRNAPHLNERVKEGKATWQELYEVWDIYGEDSTVWSQYQYNDESTKKLTSDLKFDTIMSMVKNVDLRNVENNIRSIQKFLSVIQSFISDDNSKNDVYTKRPYFKYFDD